MSMEEWDAVEEMCKVLEVSFFFCLISGLNETSTKSSAFQIFRLSTKRMEGDFPSGAVLLAEYLRIKEALQDIRKTTTFSSITNMLDAMLPKLTTYQEEAAESDLVILATIFNPKYRLRFLELHYPEHADQARDLLDATFQEALSVWPATPPASPPSAAPTGDAFDHFDVFTSATFQTADTLRSAERDLYLQGTVPIAPGQSELQWWKVSFLQVYHVDYKGSDLFALYLIL